KRGGQDCRRVEARGKDHVSPNRKAVLESGAHALARVLQTTEGDLGLCDIRSRERRAPTSAERAAGVAASPAEFDNALPVTGVERNVAQIVQGDRAVPVITHSTRNHCELLVRHSCAFQISLPHCGLPALAKRVRDPLFITSLHEGGVSGLGMLARRNNVAYPLRRDGPALVHPPNQRLRLGVCNHKRSVDPRSSLEETASQPKKEGQSSE